MKTFDECIKIITQSVYDDTLIKLALPPGSTDPCHLGAVLQDLKRFRLIEEYIGGLCNSRNFDTIYELAKFMANRKKFPMARRILEIAYEHKNFDRREKSNIPLICSYADCISKDPYGIFDEKHKRALKLLDKNFTLKTTVHLNVLSTAGDICFRYWEATQDKLLLEQALAYYLKGSFGVSETNCHVAIDAAYVLDLLADLENEEFQKAGASSFCAVKRKERAKEICESIVDCCKKVSQPPTDLEKKFNFFSAWAEALYALLDYDALLNKSDCRLDKAIDAAKDNPWLQEALARRFAQVGQMNSKKGGYSKGQEDKIWNKINAAFKLSAKAQEGLSVGKVGLALSGGGFRASLFHLGVLAKLAELDLLRHVEVLSCVSGGSIVGALYYLRLREELEKNSFLNSYKYEEIIRKTVADFRKVLQRNLRTRAWCNPFPNRTRSLARLLEEELYFPNGVSDKKDLLKNLRITPKDWKGSFSPREDNWRLDSKVPILILNATCLNTGHNWQFTTDWMGEPRAGITEDLDRHDRVHQLYYDQIEAEKHQISLGEAVAASACVPAIFPPLELKQEFHREGETEKFRVRLVDGGVNDNQGLSGLLAEDCTVLLVSDGSGQWPTENEPCTFCLNVLSQANKISMDRVREAQFRELVGLERAGICRGYMFVHLAHDLKKKEIIVDGNVQPDRGILKCIGNLRDEIKNCFNVYLEPCTCYGVPKDIQLLLATMRTDLDSFTDYEAYALMASGYLQTHHQIVECECLGEDFSLDKGIYVIENSWDFLTYLFPGMSIIPRRISKILARKWGITKKEWDNNDLQNNCAKKIKSYPDNFIELKKKLVVAHHNSLKIFRIFLISWILVLVASSYAPIVLPKYVSLFYQYNKNSLNVFNILVCLFIIIIPIVINLKSSFWMDKFLMIPIYLFGILIIYYVTYYILCNFISFIIIKYQYIIYNELILLVFIICYLFLYIYYFIKNCNMEIFIGILLILIVLFIILSIILILIIKNMESIIYFIIFLLYICCFIKKHKLDIFLNILLIISVIIGLIPLISTLIESVLPWIPVHLVKEVLSLPENCSQWPVLVSIALGVEVIMRCTCGSGLTSCVAAPLAWVHLLFFDFLYRAWGRLK